MHPSLEDSIWHALEARDDGDPAWVEWIAESFAEHQQAAAKPAELEPIIRRLFKDCRSIYVVDRLIGETLAKSPVLADRAAAALYWRCGSEPRPAVAVDWRTPGSTWFIVYRDESMLDPEGTAWADWRDYVDSLYVPEDEPKPTIYVEAYSARSRKLAKAIAEHFSELGYPTDSIDAKEAPNV